MTVLMALSSIIMEQTKAMEQTMERCTQLLDYLAGHADPKVRFNLSDMIMNIHLDASYLSEAKARSRPFPFRVDAYRQRTNSFEWGIPC